VQGGYYCGLGWSGRSGEAASLTLELGENVDTAWTHNRDGRESGEPVGIRTRDPLIKSQVLYRLSYGLPGDMWAAARPKQYSAPPC
jgi:hypothetical protein